MKKRTGKIYVLFSISNEYNQPENNLVAWWHFKPSFEMLAEVVGVIVDKEKGDCKIGSIFRGLEVRIGGANYRLRKIKEGKL